MDQRHYTHLLLSRYGLSEAKPFTTPAVVKDDGVSKSIVGSLLYAAIATRPDIAQAVRAVSKFNSCPTKAHLTATKQILHYEQRTLAGLLYKKSDDNNPIGSDADWAENKDNGHSTTGLCLEEL